MNKFIEYDIHNGITQIRCAVMNILDALNRAEIDSYYFGPGISIFLIDECSGQCGWELEPNLSGDIYCSPSGREFVYREFKLKLNEH